MITVQWCNHREIAFTGQAYMDARYSDALTDYRRKKGQWDIVRVIFCADENEGDWIVIHDVRWEDTC